MNQTAEILAFPVKHDRLLSKREAARELTVGVRTLERFMSEGRVPSLLVGGQRRFRWSVISEIKRKGTDAIA